MGNPLLRAASAIARADSDASCGTGVGLMLGTSIRRDRGDARGRRRGDLASVARSGSSTAVHAMLDRVRRVSWIAILALAACGAASKRRELEAVRAQRDIDAAAPSFCRAVAHAREIMERARQTGLSRLAIGTTTR
jgi:hypothetical protein